MWAALWAALKWIVVTAVNVVLWMIANPVATILIGAAVATAGVWITTQEWAGADAIGGLLTGLGVATVVFGIETWIGGRIAGWIGARIGRWFIPQWFRIGMREMATRWWEFF